MDVEVTIAQTGHGVSAFKYRCPLCTRTARLFGSNFIKHLETKHLFTHSDAKAILDRAYDAYMQRGEGT